METVLLTSANLICRNLRESDFDAVFAYRSHPDVCRYIGEPMSTEDVAAHIERRKHGWSRQEGEMLDLAVELRSEGVVIGEAVIRYIGMQQKQTEIGLALNPLYQNKGFGLELIIAMLCYCFEDLEIHRVIGLADVENEPMIRLSDFIGFKREGILRKNSFRLDEWRDDHIMSLLDEEWPEVKQRFLHLLPHEH